MVSIKELLPHIENWLLRFVNTRYVNEQELFGAVALCASCVLIVWLLLIQTAIDKPMRPTGRFVHSCPYGLCSLTN